MSLYQYKAADSSGKVVQGTLEGNSQEQVVAQLHALGQIPIRVEPANAAQQPAVKRSRKPRGRRVSGDQMIAMTRELGTLLQAGLPLTRALEILASLSEGDGIARVLANVQERVRQGASLADAFEAEHGLFGRFYVNLLRAGEASGALETMLVRLANHMEQSKEVRDRLLSALIYPAILVVVALASIFILLGYVVPQFSEMFAGAGQSLPLPTRITIAVGEALQQYGWLGLLVFAGGAVLLRHQLSVPASRLRWHARWLALPVAGTIITRIEVARFARTLGLLLHNGIPLLQALSIVKDTMGNLVIANGVDSVARSLKEGHSLSAPLAEAARFPQFAVNMIRVGEESGHLEEMLLQLADIYERETQQTIKRALTLLEPLLILVLGIIIALVIVSILMAILSINQLVF